MSLIDTLALAVLLTSIAIIIKPYLDNWVMRKAVRIELSRSRKQLVDHLNATKAEYQARQEQVRLNRIHNY